MATSSKSKRDPILEEKFLCFLRERIEKHDVLSIKNLTGHLSALAPYIRNHFGSSRSCLKQFLSDHPHDFFVDKKDNVKLVTAGLLKKQEEFLLKNSAQQAPEEFGSTSSSPSPNSKSTKNVSNFPSELTEVRGKVYRVFPAFGFISVTSPVVCSVYFNVSCYENGIARGFRGHTEISIGEGVFLNAKRGPDGCEAQYRATRVWSTEPMSRPTTVSESSTRSGRSSPGVSTASKGNTKKETEANVIGGRGIIENVFIKFGFISQNNNMKDNVFFHVKSVRTTNHKKISNLTGLVKQGMEVRFSAIPTEQKNAMVRWQATDVIICLDKGEDESGSDIYVSSPECSISSESDHYPNCEEMEKLNAMSQSQRCKMLNGILPSKVSSTTKPKIKSDGKNYIRNSPSSTELHNDLPVTYTGTIWPQSQSIATIIFGENLKALVLVDVFYQCEERIDNFIWELEDGQRIQFEALEDVSWAPEIPWKVLLAWVGRKPEVDRLTTSQLRDIYLSVQCEILHNDALRAAYFQNTWKDVWPEQKIWQEPQIALNDGEDHGELETGLNDHLLNDGNDGDVDENLIESDGNDGDVDENSIESDGDVDENSIESDGDVNENSIKSDGIDVMNTDKAIVYKCNGTEGNITDDCLIEMNTDQAINNGTEWLDEDDGVDEMYTDQAINNGTEWLDENGVDEMYTDQAIDNGIEWLNEDDIDQTFNDGTENHIDDIGITWDLNENGNVILPGEENWMVDTANSNGIQNSSVSAGLGSLDVVHSFENNSPPKNVFTSKMETSPPQAVIMSPLNFPVTLKLH